MTDITLFNAAALSITSGFIPAFLWLALVLFEDRKHPEPRFRLAISFVAGALAVFAVLPLQQLLQTSHLITASMLLVMWAIIEEFVKFGVSYAFGLSTRDADEPFDEIVYMAAVSLGFAAFENSLFLFNHFSAGNIEQGILLAHARFLGATLVHLVCGSIIGVFLAHTFYAPKHVRRLAGIMGALVASALHAMYNIALMSNDFPPYAIFFGLWIISGAILLWAQHFRSTYRKTQEISKS